MFKEVLLVEVVLDYSLVLVRILGLLRYVWFWYGVVIVGILDIFIDDEKKVIKVLYFREVCFWNMIYFVLINFEINLEVNNIFIFFLIFLCVVIYFVLVFVLFVLKL